MPGFQAVFNCLSSSVKPDEGNRQHRDLALRRGGNIVGAADLRRPSDLVAQLLRRFLRPRCITRTDHDVLAGARQPIRQSHSFRSRATQNRHHPRHVRFSVSFRFCLFHASACCVAATGSAAIETAIIRKTLRGMRTAFRIAPLGYKAI